MTDIIHEEDGTLDKYEGDAIIAFWSAPIEQPDHAARAVRAAIRCQRALAQRREEFRTRSGAVLRQRIGIHTGIVAVGNFGSRDRFDYTVLGDAANLASRLEGANKAFGTYCMVSETTWSRAGEGFLGRELGQVRVVGRAAPVRVFEPLGCAGEETPPYAETFARALAYCRDGKWGEALRAFEACEDDPAAAVYAARCRALTETSGTAAWDGVWHLTEK
jgi:adenylate cyclase